jgi:hypothetical protein
VVWCDLEKKPFFTSTGYKGRTHGRDYHGVVAAPEAAAIIRWSQWFKVYDPFYALCAPYDPVPWKCVPSEYPDQPWMPKQAYLDESMQVGWVGAWPEWKYLGPSTNYIRCDYTERCDENDGESIGHGDHPNPFYAQTEVIKLIESLGFLVRYVLWKLGLTYDARILVTDMSLPWGGLFDKAGDWRPPHVRHRLGGEVDISANRIHESYLGRHNVRLVTAKEKKVIRAIMLSARKWFKESFWLNDRELEDHYHWQLRPFLPEDSSNPGCVAALASFSGCPLESYPQ